MNRSTIISRVGRETGDDRLQHIESVAEKLKALKKFPHDDDKDRAKGFILKQDLIKLWTISLIEKIFPAGTFTDSKLEHIQSCFFKLLSLMVLIGAVDSFPTLFAQFSSENPRKSDQDIPLAVKDLPFLDYAKRDIFCDQQFIFNPWIIQESHSQAEIPRDYRLPFTGKTQIGSGGYGTVYKVIIPSGYKKDRDGQALDGVSIVRRPF